MARSGADISGGLERLNMLRLKPKILALRGALVVTAVILLASLLAPSLLKLSEPLFPRLIPSEIALDHGHQ